MQSALHVSNDEESTRQHVHGFHSYPARLHPMTASRLIAALTPSHGVVLDPFCGSGTVLVEARLLGRQAYGVDLSPLAVRLTRLKAGGITEHTRLDLTDAAERVAEVANHRRRERAGASRPYPEEDRAGFDPHVLMELDGLRLGIAEERDGEVRGALELVLSSILTKVEKRRGDSSLRLEPKRIAAGFPARLFTGKTHELAQRLHEYQHLLPPGAPPPMLAVGDARAPVPDPDLRAPLILTSPPYPGVYDYHSHHATRLRWLRLDDRALAEHEIGARRELNRLSPSQGKAQWEADLTLVLQRLRATLTPSGLVVLVLADSSLGGVPLFADELVERIAPTADLEVIAVASQSREHFHEASHRGFGGTPRAEHVLVLAPSGPGRPSGPQRRSQPQRRSDPR